LPHAASRSVENPSNWQSSPVGTRNEKLPFLKSNKKKGKASASIEGGVFGTKSLKNIINNIEAVEEHDIISKKTKRRFPVPPVPL
jgi:hypothetical protein